MSGNLSVEASIKDILLQTGITPDDLTRIQRETIENISFIIFYHQTWYYRQAVCETNDRERMFRVIQGNKHEPFKTHKKAKKVKERPIVDINHWGAAKEIKAKPVPVQSKVIQPHQHPDGYDLVNLPKSAAIHYAKPGGKKTLCGKPWNRPVKDEHKLDNLYPVCPKCLIKI